MKKQTKKDDSKPKEFGSKPFSTLRGFHAESPQKREEPKKSEPPLPVAPPEPDDASLFFRAVSDVKPLRSRRPAAASPAGKPAPEPPPPAALDEEERREFLDALRSLKLDVTFRDGIPAAAGAPRPLPINRLRELKRGAIRIVRELDLHGLTREEALVELARFVTSAHRQGEKALLVITGKGNNSPGEPVLQGAVVGWLREKGKMMVAEFAPAPRDLGGSGAIVVFLRRPGKEEG